MTGSASGGFYTCTYFSTDGANAWAAIGTPVKGLTGTLGSISMFPISYGATIENNDITDIQADGIQLVRYGNVLISGNRIGPHGWTINTPIAFNLQECVGVQVTGNRVALNISGSYIAKLANSRNMLFQGNYFSSPSSALPTKKSPLSPSASPRNTPLIPSKYRSPKGRVFSFRIRMRKETTQQNPSRLEVQPPSKKLTT
jgi:hypothetical protein